MNLGINCERGEAVVQFITAEDLAQLWGEHKLTISPKGAFY